MTGSPRGSSLATCARHAGCSRSWRPGPRERRNGLAPGGGQAPTADPLKNIAHVVIPRRRRSYCTPRAREASAISALFPDRVPPVRARRDRTRRPALARLAHPLLRLVVPRRELGGDVEALLHHG